MDDDESRPKTSNEGLGRALDNMSIDELDDYAERLANELNRVAAERERKLDTRQAAERLFKSSN